MKHIGTKNLETGRLILRRLTKDDATEALKAVIKFLFEECDTDTIYASYLSNNPASGKVMKKAGMIYEGMLRSRIIDKDNIRNDLGYYSVTKDEYFNK